MSFRSSVERIRAIYQHLMFKQLSGGKANCNGNINVEKWIKDNFTPYLGDSSFLTTKPTEATKKIWKYCEELLKAEVKSNGCLDVDATKPSTITSHGPGYIIKDLEKIVGLQTDAPLKRAIKPFGGIKIVRNALKAYNRQLDDNVEKNFQIQKNS